MIYDVYIWINDTIVNLLSNIFVLNFAYDLKNWRLKSKFVYLHYVVNHYVVGSLRITFFRRVDSFRKEGATDGKTDWGSIITLDVCTE